MRNQNKQSLARRRITKTNERKLRKKNNPDGRFLVKVDPKSSLFGRSIRKKNCDG